MKNALRSITLVIVLLFAVSAISADKVVVIPLGGKVATTHYYTLPGAVFVGDLTADRTPPSLQNPDGTIGVPIGYFYAPLILPNQAKLTEFVVYAKNGSTSVSEDVSLMRFDRLASAPVVMATATIPFDTATFQAFVAPSISPDVIDNIDYSYAVVIHCKDGQLTVNAVRITYTSQ